MEFVVFDLEWNMAPPYLKTRTEAQKGMPYEIFEIGAVRMRLPSAEAAASAPEAVAPTAPRQSESADGEDMRFRALVRPKLYPKLNPYVAKVTHRSTAELRRCGQPFPQVAARFFRFCGANSLLAAWGRNDTEPLKRNLLWHGLSGRLNRRVLDVQKLFALIMENGQQSQQRAVAYALEQLGLEADLPFHEALTDALYTARILRRILWLAEEKGMDGAELIRRACYNPDIRVKSVQNLPPMTGEAELEASLGRRVCACPACTFPLTRVGDWQREGRVYKAAFRCPEHGRVEGRLRFRICVSAPARLFATLKLYLEEL